MSKTEDDSTDFQAPFPRATAWAATRLTLEGCRAGSMPRMKKDHPFRISGTDSCAAGRTWGCGCAGLRDRVHRIRVAVQHPRRNGSERRWRRRQLSRGSCARNPGGSLDCGRSQCRQDADGGDGRSARSVGSGGRPGEAGSSPSSKCSTCSTGQTSPPSTTCSEPRRFPIRRSQATASFNAPPRLGKRRSR